MLDQNTDRMWYVIGAVLIGAAIIFGFNHLAPDVMASTSGLFQTQVRAVERVLESHGDNMMNEYIIYNHNPAYGSTDTSRYERDGVVRVDAWGNWGGMYLKLDDLNLQEDTTYLLKYKFETVEGETISIGGHMDHAFLDHRFFVDSRRMPNTYDYKNPMGERLIDASSEPYFVEVYFTTPAVFDSSKDLYDGRISIQPNRGIYKHSVIDIWDIELVEVL